MISVIRQFSSDAILPYVYQFAGQLVAFNEPVHTLSAFKVKVDSEIPLSRNYRLLKEFKSLSQLELLTSYNSDLCYQGEALFDKKMRTIDYWRSGDVAQIDVDGVPNCRLDLQAKCIVILNELPFDMPFNLELITGPALILLLAEQSIFCLHAGGVSFRSAQKKLTNVAFLADSGVGKSTLSRGASLEWKQLCDDILPVRIKESSVQLYHDFPQLKLDQARVKGPQLKDSHLHYIFCLSSNQSDSIVIEEMPTMQSVLALIRHTVASRLFDQNLLKVHCEFAQSLSQAVPIFQVSYPHDYAQLPELRQRIMASVI